jgi:phosphinothricin acetyltransferase
VGLVAAGTAAFIAFPGYTGSTFAWELLVLPGQALAPQLVAGFFAPRASYLLGLIAGIAQGLAFAVVYPQVLARLGTPITSDQVSGLLTVSFVTGPVSGMIFAAAAAWYRRFLALSSPRRPQQHRSARREPLRSARDRPPLARLAWAFDWRPRPTRPSIAAIYNEGIEDRVATFETRLEPPRTSRAGSTVATRSSCSRTTPASVDLRPPRPYRPRDAYAGVAEFGVYVARAHRGRGIGPCAHDRARGRGATRGFWKLVSRVFVENAASRALLASVAFARSAPTGATASSGARGATSSSSSAHRRCRGRGFLAEPAHAGRGQAGRTPRGPRDRRLVRRPRSARALVGDHVDDR